MQSGRPVPLSGSIQFVMIWQERDVTLLKRLLVSILAYPLISLQINPLNIYATGRNCFLVFLFVLTFCMCYISYWMSKYPSRAIKYLSIYLTDFSLF